MARFAVNDMLTEQVHFRITPEVYTKLAWLSRRWGKPMGTICREALEHDLDVRVNAGTVLGRMYMQDQEHAQQSTPGMFDVGGTE